MKRVIFATLALLASAYHVCAQGTLNIALSQQFAFTGCSTAANVCGTPLVGGLLYFYQVGTVSTRQDSFQDPALSVANPWPLVLDANGRVPMFYLAAGSVHARLTDAGGVVQFDQPALLVVGGTAGGGGSAVNPSTETTGDIKFRMGNPSEVIQSWVRLNGQKIGGNGSSGTACTGCDLTGDQYRAVFTYLWVNCANPTTNKHCIVALGGTAGLGASANADWTAGKSLQLPDFRGRAPFGLDDMGTARANRLVDANNAFASGDTGIIPGSVGGESQHVQTIGELVTHIHDVYYFEPNGGQGHAHGYAEPNSGQGHRHDTNIPNFTANPSSASAGTLLAAGPGTVLTAFATTGIAISLATTGIQIYDGNSTFNTNRTNTCINSALNTRCGSNPFNVMTPFVLGTWYMRL